MLYTCLIHSINKSKISFPTQLYLHSSDFLGYWTTEVNKDVVIDR